MKKAFYIFVVFALAGNCFGQDTTKHETYTVVERAPEFPGGPAEAMKFIKKNIIYPTYEKKNNITGRVDVKFVIEEDGSLSNPVITNSSGNENLDKEALRVVSIMPKWKPGIQSDKPVRVYFNLPVMFRTNSR